MSYTKGKKKNEECGCKQKNKVSIKKKQKNLEKNLILFKLLG